jgi:hypothetical protein
LVYEIVSGKAEQSLAGAINRFARSPQRRAVEEDCEAINLVESGKYQNVRVSWDDLKAQAEEQIEEANTLHALSKKRGLSHRQQEMILIRAEKINQKAERMLKTNLGMADDQNIGTNSHVDPAPHNVGGRRNSLPKWKRRAIELGKRRRRARGCN